EIESAFELIADMLMAPSFEQRELESEQNVIIEEMKMVEDSPEEFLGEIFAEAFFDGHPLGRSITGTPETVRTFDQERTRRYHQKIFHPSNLVVVAAGNIEHNRIEELTARYIRPDGLGVQQHDSPKPFMSAPIVIRQNENLEQAHLLIAAPFI